MVRSLRTAVCWGQGQGCWICRSVGLKDQNSEVTKCWQLGNPVILIYGAGQQSYTADQSSEIMQGCCTTVERSTLRVLAVRTIFILSCLGISCSLKSFMQKNTELLFVFGNRPHRIYV